MDMTLDRGELGDLSGWPSAIHAEVSDCRLPTRMIVSRLRSRLEQCVRGLPGRGDSLVGDVRDRAALPLVSLPIVLVTLAIRHRLRGL